MSITWSATNGGAEITEEYDHGGLSNGSSTPEFELFLRHAYTNPITNVGIFIRQSTGTYTGSHSALVDFEELVEWGNGTSAGTFGGVLFNMNATGGYPASSWPTVSDKSPTGGFVCRTGFGDSEISAIPLVVTTGCVSEGVIQAGASPNVRFRTKISVPSGEDTLGIREFETQVRYTYTS